MYSNIHLLQANIGMWLDHQTSLQRWLVSMWAFFLARDPEFFRKNAEVKTYIEYIKSESPDILYLSEVCGTEQRDFLCDCLEADGYAIHVEKWFELWSMEAESHRFLYHIMATRSQFQHRMTRFQYRQDRLMRYFRGINWLGKSLPKTREKVSTILDGSGSHYNIDGIEIGLIHSHADISTISVQELAASLYATEWEKQILIWDVNMGVSSMENILANKNPWLKRVITGKTYPYYFDEAGQWIFTQTIRNLMKKQMLPMPDQAYVNPWIHIVSKKNLWPQDTGLRTDHSVNHFYIRITSPLSP